MRRTLRDLLLLAVLVAGCTPAHHTYPSFYDHTVDERYLMETPYDRYWEQNHGERFRFRIDLHRMVSASSTGSERSR
jgi:hypothetical protein